MVNGTAYYLSSHSFIRDGARAERRCIPARPTGGHRARAYTARAHSRDVTGGLSRRHRPRHVPGTRTTALPWTARRSAGRRTPAISAAGTATLRPSLCAGLRADRARLLVSGPHRDHAPLRSLDRYGGPHRTDPYTTTGMAQRDRPRRKQAGVSTCDDHPGTAATSIFDSSLL